ncbi:MAG TPA: site-specific integrase, partial [Pirellulaceae bacterium]|nr:site-specific integrase [Pirellulaceae bacterium]
REKGKSAATCNGYLRSIKSFTRWLHRDRRFRIDPLATLEALNEATDRRRQRRELMPTELAQLIETTANRTLPEHRFIGPDRAMLYCLAVGTGFRASELRSLTPGSFDLDGNPATVTVAAAYSKRRRDDVQPISRSLAGLIRSWLEGKESDERLFAHMPGDTARMLRADLAAARDAWIDAAKDDDAERKRRAGSDFLAYRNAAGEVFDFHGFRHAFISAVVSGGASVKVAQELARHSSPTLTIGRYSHTRLYDLEGALAALPTMRMPHGTGEPKPQTLRATGTCGDAGPAHASHLPVSEANGKRLSRLEGAQQEAQHSGRESSQIATDGCDDGGRGGNEDPDCEAGPKALRLAGLGEHAQGQADHCESGGHGARTRNPLRGTTFPVELAYCPLPSRNVRRRTRLRS